ncbi:hypothetical protein RUM44_002641 [Polyplax serrata]|uniref:Uncharacterized protein n=1 Tax=Polyplax serrata TaxID=468196 RepID=A0ABR1AFB7_POLSC
MSHDRCNNSLDEDDFSKPQQIPAPGSTASLDGKRKTGADKKEVHVDEELVWRANE